jgi:hypothetical protein
VSNSDAAKGSNPNRPPNPRYSCASRRRLHHAAISRSAFTTYLTWFWLLTRYLAARLSVFAFLTPLFGVLAGVAILGEPLRPAFLGAVLMVGGGIYLVNRRT